MWANKTIIFLIYTENKLEDNNYGFQNKLTMK